MDRDTPPTGPGPADRKNAPPPAPFREEEEMVLAELVSRVLDRGVVVAGEVTISVAGVDLVHLDLQLRLTSLEPWSREGGGEGGAR